MRKCVIVLLLLLTIALCGVLRMILFIVLCWFFMLFDVFGVCVLFMIIILFLIKCPTLIFSVSLIYPMIWPN